MNLLLRLFFALILICCTQQALAQQTDVWKTKINTQKTKLTKEKKKQEKFINNWKKQLQEWGTSQTFKHELSIGAHLNTNGLGGQLRYTRNTGAVSQTIWLLNVNAIKHEKEIRQQRKGEVYRELGTFRPYYLGKVNSILSFQLGYGKDQILLPSVLNENINVYGSIIVGAALIVQKPVYLNLIYSDSISAQHFIKSEHYAIDKNGDAFLSNDFILGRDKWQKGIGQSSLIPGISIEPSIIFSPSKGNVFIQKIRIGANVSYYLKPIEIMALHQAKTLHASFFVGLNLGKRF